MSLVALFAFCAPATAQLKIAQGPVEAPYSLTASDGKGLELVAIEGDAVVEGPIAFTELRLTFKNPHPRRIEGQFKMVLPDGAAISRFAMKIRGSWMEGEVVEKQAARRAYEDALHRRQDPALLEQDAGNTFRARVFPIEANERKELIISWSQELRDPSVAYRLPLKGLPSIERLALRMMSRIDGKAGTSSLGGTTSRYQVQQVDKNNWVPDRDWTINQPHGDALRHDNIALARVIVPGSTDAEAISEAVVLVDTSASRAIDFEQRIERISALVSGLAQIGVKHVAVLAFDQQVAPIWHGAPADFAGKAKQLLLDREALGASNLSAALDAVASTNGAGRRLIIFSDGVVTAGELDREKLQQKITDLARVGIDRVDAVVDTTARDIGLLEALVTAGTPKSGKVVEGRGPLAEQLQRLGRKTLATVHIAVPGANWVWPSRVDGVQPGDAVLVYADLPAAKPLQITLSGGASSTTSPKPAEAAKPLLHRAWIAARIRKLEDQRTAGDQDMKAALRHQIIALSTRHRVLSSYTALLVLETENDYRRFNIDRRALADILVVGPTGVEVKARKALAVATPTPVVRRPRAKRAEAAKSTAASDDDADRADGFARGEGNAAPTTGMDMEEAPAVGDLAGAAAPQAEPSPAPPPAPTEAAAPRERRADRATAAVEDERRPMARASGGEGRSTRDRTRRRPARRRAPRRPEPFPDSRPLKKKKPTPQGRQEYLAIQKGKPALTGKMAEIDKLISKKKAAKALKIARAWRAEAPADLLALVALGRALAANGEHAKAARAFGSLLDLFPSRADMRRVAGNWLEWVGPKGLDLAIDTYTVAKGQRPDHPAIYHQLAFALLKANRSPEAFEVAVEGINARRVDDRFPGVARILQEDASLAAAAMIAADPKQADAIRKRVSALGLSVDTRNTLRFVLTWETDANDVDFHIFDKKYGHAFYQRKSLNSGGELYADVTRGYGPECFTIESPKKAPYRLKAHYYNRGPMGYGAGKLQVIRHDGKGHFAFDERPFVIMNDGAYVDLGTVGRKTASLKRAK
jgi:tetratricopeptide (TPR) repeat protein